MTDAKKGNGAEKNVVKKVLAVLASGFLFVLIVALVIAGAIWGVQEIDGLRPAHIMHGAMLGTLIFAVILISVRLVYFKYNDDNASVQQHKYNEQIITLLAAIVGGLFVLMAFRVDDTMFRLAGEIKGKAEFEVEKAKAEVDEVEK